MIALITGITGQDGSYLTEALLGRGDVVHGTVRRTSTLERSRLAHLYADPAIHNKQLFLHFGGILTSSLPCLYLSSVFRTTSGVAVNLTQTTSGKRLRAHGLGWGVAPRRR